MNNEQFREKHYSVTMGAGHEKFHIYKSGSWINLTMITNDKISGEITFRSKEHLEQLHFALGQLLNE